MAKKTGATKRNISAKLFFALSARGLLNFLPARAYLSALWFCYFHKKFDWNNPKSFNEKIQWLKVFDQNPLYPVLVDKFAVRNYVKREIGEQYLIPLVGGPWNTFDEIDFDLLPDRFVLKSTHDSGGVVICRGKAGFDRERARVKLTKSLKRNYYWGGREWPYREITPRIIAEAYMGTDEGVEPADYKFFLFGGEYRAAFVTTNRLLGKKMNMTFFDADWNKLPFERVYPADTKPVPRPAQYEKMVLLAKRLAKELPLARIDLYEIDGKVYFGEITLYPGSGLETFQPEEWDYRLGEWIDLKRFFPQYFR